MIQTTTKSNDSKSAAATFSPQCFRYQFLLPAAAFGREFATAVFNSTLLRQRFASYRPSRGSRFSAASDGRGFDPPWSVTHGGMFPDQKHPLTASCRRGKPAFSYPVISPPVSWGLRLTRHVKIVTCSTYSPSEPSPRVSDTPPMTILMGYNSISNGVQSFFLSTICVIILLESFLSYAFSTEYAFLDAF